ncbi:hypothetical protein [Photobacterium sp. Hal280]|uniref:hypothetical protein n=1 Tax=Photobacterium sp. Hal280 TaxID=3035163 RepID=UPI00301DED78
MSLVQVQQGEPLQKPWSKDRGFSLCVPEKCQTHQIFLSSSDERFDTLNAAHSLSLAWPAALTPAGGAASETLVERPGFFFMRPGKMPDASDLSLLQQ